jgi:hypothetical protein
MTETPAKRFGKSQAVFHVRETIQLQLPANIEAFVGVVVHADVQAEYGPLNVLRSIHSLDQLFPNSASVEFAQVTRLSSPGGQRDADRYEFSWFLMVMRHGSTFEVGGPAIVGSIARTQDRRHWCIDHLADKH